jgi:hypothetical protein
MTSRLATVAVASVAALGVAGVASASSGHAAKTYKGTLSAVNPAATTAGVANVRGRVQLVDGTKRNKVTLHVRHLAPKTVYLWHVHVGTCAATGAPVPGWQYRTADAAGNGTLKTNSHGNANTKGKSATFNVDPTQSYSVNVHVAAATNGLAAGTIIACADLTPTKHAHTHQSHGKGPKS